jgi:hypothetical protein
MYPLPRLPSADQIKTNRISATVARTYTSPPATRRPLIESLESRLLLSGDLIPGAVAPEGTPAPAIQETVAAPPKPQAAPDGGIAAPLDPQLRSALLAFLAGPPGSGGEATGDPQILLRTPLPITTGGPGKHCAACHPPQSPARPAEPAIDTGLHPLTVTEAGYFESAYNYLVDEPPRAVQLGESGVVVMPRANCGVLETGTTVLNVPGETYRIEILEPGQVMSTYGCGPCVGVILVPPTPGMPTYGYHFSAGTDPEEMVSNLPPGYIAILNGAECNPEDPPGTEEAERTLSEVLEALEERGIKPEIYVPGPNAGVDHNGNVVWTTPRTTPTQGYND